MAHYHKGKVNKMTMLSCRLVTTLLLLSGGVLQRCDAFVSSSSSRSACFASPVDSRLSTSIAVLPTFAAISPTTRREGSHHQATRLAMLPAAMASAVLSRLSSARLITKLCLFLSATLLVLFRQKSQLLWPKTAGDPNFTQPVPLGPLGCPFFGLPFFIGSTDYGAGAFYLKQAAKLPMAARKLWKFYFLGNPFVVVAGADNVKAILNKEFEPNGLRSATRRSSSLGTGASIISEQDKSRHQFLRRLIGQAITPAAVAKSYDTLQQAAQETVDKMLTASANGPVVMEDVCTDFTLDVAWRQILGLDLSPDQVPVFHKAVADWIGGIISINSLTGIGLERTPSYKALKYLENLVDQQVTKLRENGPDASTLSGMVFAKDEENPTRTLSQREIIDNAMILILAGSETSASTLTNAMLFLGLNRGTWDKLVQEQRRAQAVYGDKLTKEVLDKECPYLEAVIKETMRIRPISGGIPRRTTATMVMNGYQIPKDWLIDFNVPLTHQLDPKTFLEDGSNMDIYKGFVPDRWLSPDTTPTDFIPMGAGPRYCLGSNLAYAEMKIFLATMARTIDFKLVKEQEPVEWKLTSIIPKPKDGVVVEVVTASPVPV